MNIMKITVTDTFAGEANFAWVRRYESQFAGDETDYALIRRAKKLAGYNGMRCRKEQLGETLALYPYGQAVVIFVEFN